MDIEDISFRRRKVEQIMSNLKKIGKRITRFTVQEELDKIGFHVSSVTAYRDMTAVNRENTWVRDLAQSNYSAYQEQISDTLEWIEMQSEKRFEKTKSHVWLNIILKVQETKMKHTNGENINVSAALIQRRFEQMTKELEKHKQDESVDVLKMAKDEQNSEN